MKKKIGRKAIKRYEEIQILKKSSKGGLACKKRRALVI